MASNSPFISIQKVQNGNENLCFVIKAKKHFFCEAEKKPSVKPQPFFPNYSVQWLNWIITLPNCYSSIIQAKLELQLLINVYYDGWQNESLFLQNKLCQWKLVHLWYFRKFCHFFWYLATGLGFYRTIFESIYFVENTSTHKLYISEPDYVRQMFSISIQFKLILRETFESFRMFE